MIKLVVSDIDGTLLHGAETEINPELFVELKRLREKGILFCPASGRQYASQRHLFAPIADEICYVCDNGSILYGEGANGEILDKTVLDTMQTQKLCAEILAIDGVEIVISGANTLYLCPKEQDLSNRLNTYLASNTMVVPSPADIPEDIIKVCLFSHVGMQPELYALQERWKDVFHVAVSGRQWLDFTLGNKAHGVEVICKRLGIAPTEVLAVGDNFNDVTMLELVGHPYIMANAVPELRTRFQNHCENVIELLKTL